MIENTFLFLPGVGKTTEKKIWEHGVENWNDFLQADDVPGIGQGKKVVGDKHVRKAQKALRQGNASFFTGRLPSSEHWRLYENFKSEACFLDIETTGTYGKVTVIGMYDGFEVKHLVRGANLYKEALEEELNKYNLIVTFNGKSFDVPVINEKFDDVVPEVPHLDLRHACARLGLTGGLKQVEKELEVERESLVDGMRGNDAVILWEKFKMTQKEKYLEQLLKYNAEDIINLKPIADYVVKNLKKTIKSDKRLA